jgi:hypothetical protein
LSPSAGRDAVSREIAKSLERVPPRVLKWALSEVNTEPEVVGSSVGVGRRDPDCQRVLALEIKHLLGENPPQAEDLAGSRSRWQRAWTLSERNAPTNWDHSSRALWWLLGGRGQVENSRPRQTKVWRSIRQGLLRGWLAKPVAAALMQILIAAPVLVVFFTLWGPLSPSRHTAPDLGEGALKVFAVWCLAFLPGWLYLRFLGQRAGALWDEFVVHLHRLGLDNPENLPRPPLSSQFYDEWFDRGGPWFANERNMYREKFDSYYGRAVSAGPNESDFTVRVDTLFPVFLTTLVLATCWVAVLWNTSFLEHPNSVWDILKFAFFGAYAFIAQSLVRRFFQNDLKPSAYAAAVLRIIVVLLTMAALHQLLTGVSHSVEAATAFVVGFFPIVALQALTRAAATTLRAVVPQVSPDYPLNQLDGLNVWYESRLIEEGIEDMENLATANLVDVVLHTRVPVGRLVDWVDQANLYIHLDRTERGWGERRRTKMIDKATSQHTVAQLKGERIGKPTTLPPGSTNSPVATETGASNGSGSIGIGRLHGSINAGQRAGTQTRIALRQLGIRSATDLLNAFPPEQVDPTRGGIASDKSFVNLWPRGVEKEQIRTLVRVLAKERHLVPVWNWKSRGIAVHHQPTRSHNRKSKTIDLSDQTHDKPGSNGTAASKKAGASDQPA